MPKLGLIAAAAATLLLAACGGSTKTVTLTSPTSSGAPSSGGTAGASTVPASVISCFKGAGATIRGPVPAGHGSAVYVLARDGGNLGYVAAPSSVTAFHIAEVFASSGDKIKTIKGKNAFAFSKGTVSSADSALLSKCSK